MKKINISRLRDLRKESGLKQGKMSDILSTASGVDVDLRTLQNWEAGRNVPNADMLCCIADYFGVSTDYLLSRSDLRTPEHDFINRETGLNDSAIDGIRKINQDQESRKVLNVILSLPEFSDYVREYVSLVESQNIDRISKLFEKLNENSEHFTEALHETCSPDPVSVFQSMILQYAAVHFSGSNSELEKASRLAIVEAEQKLYSAAVSIIPEQFNNIYKFILDMKQ